MNAADTDADDVGPLLDQRRRTVDAALDRALPDEGAWPSTIHRAVRYSLFAGGKRIRPQIVLAAAEAAGGDPVEAMPFACAVEMIHTYSLVHDDLPAMDDDDLRRGKPTSHKVFGEAMAILAGDALLTRAFHLLAEDAAAREGQAAGRRARVMVLLGEAAGTCGLIGGQVADLESEGQAVGKDALERLHRAKTGALLGACVRGGAILGGAPAEDEGRLARYADAIGLAFQIVDDVLDATADSLALGKTAGKDQKAHKATYVSVYGVARAREMAGGLLADAREALRPLGPKGRVLEALAARIVLRDA